MDLSRVPHIIHSLKIDDKDYMRVFSYMFEGGDVLFRTILGANAAPLVETLKAYKKACTFTPREGYVPKDKSLGERQVKEWMRLWREGLQRWDASDAMTALPGPHWEGRTHGTLSCRWARRTTEAPFVPKVGSGFVLRKSA